MDQESNGNPNMESRNYGKQQGPTNFFEELPQNQEIPPLMEPEEQEDDLLSDQETPLFEKGQRDEENQYYEQSNALDSESELEQSQNTPSEQQVSEQRRNETKKEVQYSEKYIMKGLIKETQEKNTPRFLVRMFIKYLEEYRHQYSPGMYQLVRVHCEEESNRVRKSKRHVFLVTNLKGLLDNEAFFGKECCKINRRVFSSILSRHALSEMFLPRSQIKKNKKKYLQTSKVYKLRCRCKNLVNRLQSQ